MQQQLQQAGQQIQMLSKELEARVEQIKTEQVKQQAQVQMKQLEGELKVKLQEMQDATSIRIAEINAATKGYQTEAQHAAQHEAQALDIQASAVQSEHGAGDRGAEPRSRAAAAARGRTSGGAAGP
jgi:hypothetical protein